MKLNYEEKKQEIIEWLMHPSELGCEPAAIEFTKEFTDEDGIQCLIYKYKKTKKSPWLLAIASDSGIFSEMQEYEEDTQVEDAKELINFLKEYWKNAANKEMEREERRKEAEHFHAFVLLKEPEFDYEAFETSFSKEWKMNLTSEEDKESEEESKEDIDTKIYDVDSMRIVVGYMGFPVPNEEAEYNAQYNYMWKDAVEVTKTHQAHILVAILGEGSFEEKGILYAKVITTLCRESNILGVYANGVVYEPRFILAMSEIIEAGELPIFDLVWFGLAREEDGVSAYTCGMTCFGKDEIEIVNSQETPSDIRDLLISIAEYVITEDVLLHDGETIGFSNEQRLKIVRSEGVNVENESLKIIF